MAGPFDAIAVDRVRNWNATGVRNMTAITKAGRYELLEELGRGAMGVVYRAHDPVIGRTVAVKTLRVTEHASGLPQEELLRRFHTEARAAGLLSHPNIVSVYDAGKEDDFFYITMELVEGKSLQDLLGERHAFPLARVLRLMQQACSALDFAHQHNVVHRDIKPANLILTQDDTLKISDFGTAKIMQFQTAQTGQIVGTPSYMSPEQIKGRPVDGRSDIFSLGGVLYELLTGEKPFPGDSITAVIYRIVSEDPAPPREIDSSIHPGLSAIVMRALAKSPNARFQSCCQFFDALQNYRDYQPGSIPAPAPETAERMDADYVDSATMPSAPAITAASEPSKQGGSVWLALFLLAVIGAAGYKVWPALHELWLRAQPEPIAILPRWRSPKPAAANAIPESAPASGAPSAPAVGPSSEPLPYALAAPIAAQPVTAAVAASAVVSVVGVAPDAKTPIAAPAPAVITSAPRPQSAKPSVSPAAAEWRQHVATALGKSGLGNRVKVVAVGSTLTLIGRLDVGSHSKLLGLLKNSPSNVQIVDHIDDTETPAAEP